MKLLQNYGDLFANSLNYPRPRPAHSPTVESRTTGQPQRRTDTTTLSTTMGESLSKQKSSDKNEPKSHDN